MKERVLNWASVAVDRIWDLKSYQTPPGTDAPKIVAHRGAWDADHLENTMAAFKHAQQLGAWGIELDVHFSKDGVPVVHHDADLLRCHRQNGIVCDLKFDEMRKIAPLVPTLEEVLALKNLHFMIEIKTSLTKEQQSTLDQILNKRTPTQDFHFLTLDPERVRTSSAMPPESWILVGELILKDFVKISLERNYGGVAGHFLGMNTKLRDQLRSKKQRTGVGFTPTANMYRREWQREIDWVFTNSLKALKE